MIRTGLALFVSALVAVEPCLAQSVAAPPPANKNDRYLQIVALGRQRRMTGLQTRAAQGDMKAAVDLGYMYEHGEEVLNIQPDYLRARDWYAYAAQGGNPNGGYMLATFYLGGRPGIPKDKDRANYIMLWAASKGDPSSVRTLELEGFDMRAERAKLDALARAHEEQRKAEAARSEAAAEGLATIAGYLLFMGTLSGMGDASEDPRCGAWRRSQLFGTPAGATLPPGFSPVACH